MENGENTLILLTHEANDVSAMRSLGDRIRQLRNERDLSLRELAKLVEVSAPFLSDVEGGKRFPKDDTLEKIARALRTTVADLKSHDTRAPAKEMLELADENSDFAIAFRRVIEHVRDQELTPMQLMKMVTDLEGKKRRNKK